MDKEIDRLAKEYWRTGDKDGMIQISVKNKGYSLDEWMAALRRHRPEGKY